MRFREHIRMLSEVLQERDPAVDARPALSTSDSTWWTDRVRMRPDTGAPTRYGVCAAALHTSPLATGPDRLLAGQSSADWAL